MRFEYLYETTSQDSIEINRIGQVCLKANDDSGNAIYLIIKTNLGWSSIETFGPINLDSNVIKSGFFYNYSKIEYSEYKLKKSIDKFLNNIICVTQVEEVEEEAIRNVLKNLSLEKL